MSLVDCSECGSKVSTNAASCPHCGNPIIKSPEISPDTSEIELKITSPGEVLAGILGLVGLITLFFIPPIGFLMLMVAGIFGMFGKKKEIGRIGNCPHCASRITLPKRMQGGGCPICKKSFLNKESKFVKA